ncbi:MAG TPA: 4Fe-4S dicluster domain-containing protein [Micromonosporaceae bacterium]|nr:4Fe-4S dicluster domain-containing protein [Micromonosporaceae bacterium]
MAALLESLEPLVTSLREDGYTVIGPVLADGAVVLAELESAAELPYGWGSEVTPGGYRLRRRRDRAAFAHQAGPQSWKSYLHPPRVQLWTVQRKDFTVTEPEAGEEPPRYAFLGVRPCDLRAIAVQDRVLGGVDGAYARRRAAAFLVAVDCTEPGPTCFCASAGGGTAAGDGADLVLTELVDGDAVSYLAEPRSAAGQRRLASLPQRPATAAEVDRARGEVAAAAERMGRSLPATDLRALLAERLDAGRWAEVAQRCLSCGNCTMVCPTCFCTTVEDTSDLTGEVAGRWLRWDSCFDLDFSYLHGGAVRRSVRSRYRQWLTHKLGTWHDQFGEAGCVGCGRCIVWCPVGIDLTEEVAALAKEEAGP